MSSTRMISFVLALALTSSTCYATNFLTCTGKTLTSTINQLTVSNCPKLPCTLEKGTNITVAVDFTMKSGQSAETATTSVHGIIAGEAVPYTTHYTDACQTAGLNCPLKPSSRNTYTPKLYVAKYDPSIELYVKWELLDQAKNDIFCFKIPAQIKS